MTDDTVVVQLVLRPASGRRITGDSVITTATLHDYSPSADSVDVLRHAFSSAGFVVGPLVGVSMSASGSRGLIEAFFGTHVETTSTDGNYSVAPSGQRTRELPLELVSADIAHRLDSATFEPPAEAVDDGTVTC